MDSTPASLLEQLKQPASDAAWQRFVDLYTPLLHSWASRLGLQPSDAADLLQDLFLFLYKQLPRFAYQPEKSFRGWLRTVLTNRWRQWQSRRTLAAPAGGLDQIPAPADSSEFEELQYRRELVRQALRLLALEFPQATWDAFCAYALENQPAAEVAARLGVSVNSVYIAKTRVLARLRQELKGLLD